MTCLEYISLLRQHVAKGRRADTISSKHRHLDRSSFWHAQYERTRDSLKKSEDEKSDLRRENEALKSKGDAPRPATAIRPATAARPGTASRKRKKQDEDTIPVPRSPKKAKRAASPPRLAPLDIAGYGELDEVGAKDELVHVCISRAILTVSVPVLLRRVFDIHATVKAHGKTDTTRLAHHVIEAAFAVSGMVKQSVEERIASVTPDLQHFKSILIAASRATASIFVGLNRISHVPEGSVVQGRVVHAIVQMFRDILSQFEWLASAEIEKAENELANLKAKKGPTGGAETKATSAKSVAVQGSPSLNALTALLSNIIGLLDSRVNANKAVFEGIAFCILHRGGRRLYSTVFGHTRASTLEAEILQSRAIDEIEDIESMPSKQEQELEQKRIKMEGPYLIHLLTRIMTITPTYLGAAISTKTGKPKQANNKGSMKGALAITAKDCLQSTLVNAIFGMEGLDENDPFIDCLKMPVPGTATIPVPKVKGPEVGEWFKGEMWKLLGWEILSRIDG